MLRRISAGLTGLADATADIRALVALGGTGLLVLAGVLLSGVFGLGVAPLSALPAALAGSLLGVRAGLAAGLVLGAAESAFVAVGAPGTVIATLLGGGLAMVGGVVSGAVRERLDAAKAETAAHAEAEAKWHAAHDRLHEIADLAPIVIMRVDRDACVQYVNRSAREMGSKVVRGRPVYDFVPAVSHEALREALGVVLRTGKPRDFQVPGLGLNGKAVWYTTRVGPVMEKGKVAGALLLSVDITGLRAERQQLSDLASAEHVRADDMEAMVRIAAALLSPISFADKATVMMDQVARRTDAAVAIMRRPTPDGRGLRLVARAGPDARALRPEEVLPLHTTPGRVYTSGMAQVTNDVPATELQAAGMANTGVKSVAAVPIRADGKVIAVVAVLSKERDRFSQERLRFLSALCDGMGVFLAAQGQGREERSAGRSRRRSAGCIGDARGGSRGRA